MIEQLFSAMAMASVLAVPPDPLVAGRGAISTQLAMATPVLVTARAPQPEQAFAPPKDSLKNGAIIGAIVGAAVVGLGFGMGCYAGEFMSSPQSTCNGAFVTGLLVGAGAGGLAGAGLDAVFSHANAPPSRRVVGVSWRF